MKTFTRISNTRVTLAFLSSFLMCLTAATGVIAGANPLVDTLKQTPISVFTYALQELGQNLRGGFANPQPDDFAKFTAPLSGNVADLTTVIYDDKNDKIILNLVRIKKFDEGTKPEEVCRQAMAGLRTFAGLDPATGALAAGMDTSYPSISFYPKGTPIPQSASNPADIDKLFRLRFNGFIGTKRFTCTADMLATDYQLEIK